MLWVQTAAGVPLPSRISRKGTTILPDNLSISSAGRWACLIGRLVYVMRRFYRIPYELKICFWSLRSCLGSLLLDTTTNLTF